MCKEGSRRRGIDGDMGERSKGVRSVCSTTALHLTKAEEVDREGWREVCRVHAVGGWQTM